MALTFVPITFKFDPTQPSLIDIDDQRHIFNDLLTDNILIYDGKYYKFLWHNSDRDFIHGNKSLIGLLESTFYHVDNIHYIYNLNKLNIPKWFFDKYSSHFENYSEFGSTSSKSDPEPSRKTKVT
jgi:hypothetical protein